MNDIEFDKLQKQALTHFVKKESAKAYDKWKECLNCDGLSLDDDTIATLWYNMGLAKSQESPGEGFEEYVHAIKNAKTPTAANESKWNLSLCLLYNNEHLGWLLYDTRFLRKNVADGVKFTQLPIPFIPMSYDSNKTIDQNVDSWIDENIDGKHLLILDEQGFGDSIMFASVWPTVATRAKSLVIQCKKELLSLYQNSFKQYKNIEFIGSSTLPAQSVMSRNGYTYAGTAFGMMYKKYQSTCYLKPSAERIQLWKDNFGSLIGRKIGFNLMTNQNAGNANERSIKDSSLQKKIALDIDAIGSILVPISPTSKSFANLKILDSIRSKITDFEDSAAIMSLVDEVISVSTASAHLAGAIGVKTRVYFQDDTNEWRWCKNWRSNVDSSISILYPSVKIIDISTLT